MYLTFKELTRLGIPIATIKYGVMRYRKELSSSWKSLKDSNDARKILIELDSIPNRTKEKYNVPTSEEYQQKRNEVARIKYEAEKIAYEKEKAKQEEKFIKEQLFASDVERKSLVEAYNKNWFQYLETYRKWYAHNPKRCEELAEQSAKDYAFWIQMLSITGTEYKAYRGKVKIGFEHYQDVKNRIKLTTNTNNLIHFRKFLKELREAKNYNDDLFVEKIAIKNSKPKNNRTKTDEFHKGLALSILSHEKIYAYRVVTDLINHHCKQEEKPTITESWLKALMSKDNQFKTLVSQYRYGAKHFDDFLLPHAVRKRPTYPGNVWMIDGTPIQFFCYNESKTKLIRLYLFAVIDVCSRKIVGYDVAYSEDRYSIMQSIKLAVINEGHLPAEIVSDNFSANKTEEIKTLKEQMKNLGVYWRHSKVENAKDKSYIERYFGVFQSVECALYDDYIGEGIKSKRLNARPNEKFLQRIAKKNNTPTVKEMMHRISVMISTYNQRTLSENKAPNLVYSNMPKPNVKVMDTIKTAIMFWTKTKHTVKRGMVKIKVRKTEYVYEIHEHELKAKLQGKQVAVRYDINDLETIMLFDLKHDFPICECKQAVSIHLSVADRTEQDEKNTAIIEAKKKSYKKYLSDAYDEQIDKGLKSVNKDTLDIIHPLSLDKNTVNTKEDALHQLFVSQKSIYIDDEEKRDYKTIKTLTRKNINSDVHESLLQNKKPSMKGSLKVIGRSNNNDNEVTNL
jgi:transposase InsO family protein